ncbi:MAG: type II toxin-antitoxin system RelE/ParE family toxin, partial [Dissulfuribacterales bacterium]
ADIRRRTQTALSLSAFICVDLRLIKHCHEVRINDENLTWRIIYKIYSDAILILEVFEKKTTRTPKSIINIKNLDKGNCYILCLTDYFWNA